MSQSTSPTPLRIPVPSSPFIGPDGNVSREWLYVIIGLWTRTGGGPGLNIGTVSNTANTAETTATAAGAAAAAAQVTANGAQTSATAANVAVAAETVRAEAAEALRAFIDNPTFTGVAPVFGSLFGAFANDAGAAGGGIVVGQLYWNTTVGAVAQRRV